MKKLIIISLSILLSATFVNSEIICMKNSKRFQVNLNGKVNVRTPKLLTVADSTCPNGYTQLTSTPPEESKTYTGVWSLSDESVFAARDAVSFPKALNQTPSQVIIVQAFTTDPICNGSVDNPTAPAGVLCIYEQFSFALKNDFGERYDVNSASSDYRFGFIIIGYKGDNPFPYNASGTWAVTDL